MSWNPSLPVARAALCSRRPDGRLAVAAAVCSLSFIKYLGQTRTRLTRSALSAH